MLKLRNTGGTMIRPTLFYSSRAALFYILAIVLLTPANTQAVSPGSGESASTIVPAGTRILLRTKSSISTRNARNGDSFYAIVDYPVVIDKRVAIPADSLVRGVIVDVQKGGRVRGRAQITISLEQLMLINGVQKPIDAEILSVDASAEAASVQRGGRIQAPSGAGQDARTIFQTGSQGAIIGAIAGGGKGLAIGSAAGALAGISIVLSTRERELELWSGAGIEVVLQKPLEFTPGELDFSSAPVMPPARYDPETNAGTAPRRQEQRGASCCSSRLGWPVYWPPVWVVVH
jgi:hypothetical protein